MQDLAESINFNLKDVCSIEESIMKDAAPVIKAETDSHINMRAKSKVLKLLDFLRGNPKAVAEVLRQDYFSSRSVSPFSARPHWQC